MNQPAKLLVAAVVLAASLVGGFFAYEHLSVGAPVKTVLAEDTRNEALVLSAGFAGLSTSTLELDVKDAAEAAPVDLIRSLFQVAELFHDKERHFESVQLSRRGEPVFVMKGEDFAEIGNQVAYGENPVYLVRKLPSKLYLPNGLQAYAEWEGGLLGVLAREMEDVTDAALKWAIGGAGGAGGETAGEDWTDVRAPVAD